ncbi:unnamed protein product [Cylicostephanus goldi]|uniref:Uncharacterized protein n=1 Tax=Cylicostephanus goldi TaxID=71465 RepID=A0A3P7R2B5_CYLGO|nr:unnamed protein product [Cylicostephanus goldi]
MDLNKENDLQDDHAKELEQLRTASARSEESSLEKGRRMEQLQFDYDEAMEKVRTLADEKAAGDAEVLRLQEELSRKQNELVSLRIKEANTAALYSEAKYKITTLEKAMEERSRVTQIETASFEIKKTAILMESEEVGFLLLHKRKRRTHRQCLCVMRQNQRFSRLE